MTPDLLAGWRYKEWRWESRTVQRWSTRRWVEVTCFLPDDKRSKPFVKCPAVTSPQHARTVAALLLYFADHGRLPKPEDIAQGSGES